jgi:hypothetical protein
VVYLHYYLHQFILRQGSAFGFAAASASASVAAPKSPSTMASAAVAAWTACVTGLQKLVSGALPPPEQSLLTLQTSNLDQKSPLPYAALKNLVQENKVRPWDYSKPWARVDARVIAYSTASITVQKAKSYTG